MLRQNHCCVYVVTLRHAPVSLYYGGLRREVNGFKDAAAAPGRTQFNKPRRYHLTQTQAWFEGFMLSRLIAVFLLSVFPTMPID